MRIIVHAWPWGVGVMASARSFALKLAGGCESGVRDDKGSGVSIRAPPPWADQLLIAVEMPVWTTRTV
jgi:hypothetical protein